MARPATTPFSEAAYALLEPAADGDEALNWPLLCLVIACSAMFDPVDAIVRNSDDYEGWGSALDANTVPLFAVPWLAQFSGVDIDTTQLEAIQRAAIIMHPKFARGTIASMVAAGQTTMTGTRTINVVERSSGDAWEITMTASPAEVPNAAATLAAMILWKPMGINLIFNGLSSMSGGTVTLGPSSFLLIRTNRADFTAVAAAYSTFQHMRDDGV